MLPFPYARAVGEVERVEETPSAVGSERERLKMSHLIVNDGETIACTRVMIVKC